VVGVVLEAGAAAVGDAGGMAGAEEIVATAVIAAIAGNAGQQAIPV